MTGYTLRPIGYIIQYKDGMCKTVFPVVFEAMLDPCGRMLTRFRKIVSVVFKIYAK